MPARGFSVAKQNRPGGKPLVRPERGKRPIARLRRPIPEIREVSGLPPIDRGTKLAFARDGSRLYIGKDSEVEEYIFEPGTNRARRVRCAVVKGRIHALDLAPDGTLYVWTAPKKGRGPSMSVGVLAGDRITEIATLPGEVGATAVTRSHLAAVVAGKELEPPRLVLLGRRTGKLVARENLGSSRARLTAGRKDELVIEDASQAGQFRWTDTAQAARRCRPGGGGTPPGRPQPPGSSVPTDPCAACCKPKPQVPPDSSVPLPDPNPNGRPDPCVPGGGGTPDGCFVTYVNNGVVHTLNLCEPNPEPCSVQLLFPIAEVRRTPRAVVATSSDRKRLAILESQTLRLLYEHRPSSGAFRTLVARDAESLLLLSDSGAAFLLDPTPVLPAFPGLDPQFQDAAKPVAFQGQAAAVDWQSGREQTGFRNVMIIPVLEPGQGFNGDPAAYFDHYEMQAALERVQAFHIEASYHQPPDVYGLEVYFEIFGVNTPQLYTGPPIQIPKAFREYWNEGWQPGGIESTAAIPAGGTLRFSGDEELTLQTFPEIVQPRSFAIRFPAASFRVRIAESASGYTLDFGPAFAARVIAIQGSDRSGTPFNISASTAAWTDPPQSITISQNTLENGSAASDLEAALETLLDTVPGQPFAPPVVHWQNDGAEWGMLHVTLFFADAGGGEEPTVTVFDADSSFLELSPGGSASIAASFDLPGAEATLAEYVSRVLADATVDEFGQNEIQNSHFDYKTRPPVVETDGGSFSLRINLAPDHGRTADEDNPARIERESQSGLSKIGMNAPQVINGGTTKISGSGAPTLEHQEDFFNDIFTAMVDAAIADQGGPEASRIDVINRILNCDGLTEIECAFDLIHNFVVVPVMRNPFGAAFAGATQDPDVGDLRATARGAQMIDLKTESGERAKAVLPIGANRKKIFSKLRFSEFVDEEVIDRHLDDADVISHELGHGILGYSDQYSTSAHRDGLVYIGGYDYMGDSGSAAHMTSYHKRISGWLADDAILLLDRPDEDSPIDREVVLVQLEAWDPGLGEDAYNLLVQTVMPDTPSGTPVVAAVFLRLGGDAHTFEILELRGPGPRFSAGIDPPRVLALNAVDPRDRTRYGEAAEDAGIVEDALLRYRRYLHLLDDGMRSAGDSFDFGEAPELAEAGLVATLLEMATANTGSYSFSLARVRIQWERGRAIDLGFQDSLPDWQSPDIAIFMPPDIPEEGLPEFPENQSPEAHETFMVPADGEGPLEHLVLARVWNFGDAEAFNVQVELVQRIPDGGGDWDDSVIGSETLTDPLGPGDNAIVAFPWTVASELDTHICLRAQVGDRDPEPGASDDTTDENNWAQQNVFIYEAPAESPPKPVEFLFSVTNDGPYTEEVRLIPSGLRSGAKLTVTPRRLRIRGNSRGAFRVRVELEERLLKARCGKDISFLLEAWRLDDHEYEQWGAAKYTIKPRLATKTDLEANVLPDQLHLTGAVTPDVGAFPVLFHIDLPGQEPFWEERILGPGSTFDLVIPAEIPPNVEVRATARFNGSQEYASSVSKTVKVSWQKAG